MSDTKRPRAAREQMCRLCERTEQLQNEKERIELERQMLVSATLRAGHGPNSSAGSSDSVGTNAELLGP